MDGQTLQQLFAGPNPFLAQMGEQAFNLDQQKRQADLATTLGLEQRNAAMHPLEMQNKQAVTRLNNSTADINEYGIATRLPKEQALAQNMQKFFKESDEMTQQQTRMKVQRMMQIAQMAKSNGGALPPGIQLSPEEIQQYSPGNLDKLIKYGETFFASDPKEIAARQRAAEQMKLEQERQKGRIDLKATPGANGPGGKPPSPKPMSNEAISADLLKLKEARQKLAQLKVYYPLMSPEQKQQWLPIIAAIKKQAENEPLIPQTGKVDPVGSANSKTGEIVARPAVDLGGAPGAVSNRPARQTASEDVVIYKDGKAVGMVSKADVAQAIKDGYTVK